MKASWHRIPSLVLLCVLSLMVVLRWAGCKGVIAPGLLKAESPKYGGVLTLAYGNDVTGFDDARRDHYECRTLNLTNDKLTTGDWTKGRAGGYGSGQCDWFMGGSIGRMEYTVGQLAERFEVQKDKFVFYLRKGVRWHNKPPTNGREMNADDVVASLERHLQPPLGSIYRYNPAAAASVKISKLDDYTVVVTVDPKYFIWDFIDYNSIFPKDAIEAFGSFTDWKNSLGSGPFMLSEYVAGSHAYFVRNPDYWEKDPVGPGKGNQLPYLDGVKMLVIPDDSTRWAAFRTGQVDVTGCGWEQAQEFLKDPRLKHVRYLEDWGATVIYMRTDKKDSPFADKRVRQALWLGLDQRRILNELYGGEGSIHTWPLMPIKEFQGAYVPLEKLPPSVQRLFEYHPEEAKRLLAEAGYPNGFKATIVYYNVPAYTDVLSMVKADWAKIGVELELQPRDFATFTAIHFRRAHTDMMLGWYSGSANYFRAYNWSGQSMWNSSYVDDPLLNQARDNMIAAWPDEPKMDAIHRQLMPYLLEQAYVISVPAGYTYRFWWPWVKNYSGESSVGYYSAPNWVKYAWIDQELKRSILGQ